MGSLSLWHWLVILAVIILILGSKRIRTLGADLGGAVRSFREGMGKPDESGSPSHGEMLPPSSPTAGAPKEKHSV
jgi:sec-independent protein translocase protein TatA